MNWPEAETTDLATDVKAQTETDALFPGDTGHLPLDARRALCQLLSGPSIDGRRHSHLWPALLREEAAIRSRLSELFLELVLDRDMQVAFTRQVDTGELETPILLRSRPLTFIDSVLLLYLRQRLGEADAQGQRAAVEEAELHEQLSIYEKALGTDRAGYTKKIVAAIEKMKKDSILQRIRGSDGRFEVSPTLKLLFSAGDVQALIRVYRERREIVRDAAEPDEEADE